MSKRRTSTASLLDRFYGKQIDFSSITQDANPLMSERGQVLNVVMGSFRESFFKSTQNPLTLNDGRYQISKAWQKDELSCYTIKFTKKINGKQHTTEDRFIAHEHDGIVEILSFCPSWFFKEAVLGLLSSYHVDFIRSFMTQPLLYRIIDTIQDSSAGYRMQITKAVLRQRHDHDSQTIRRVRQKTISTDVKYNIGCDAKGFRIICEENHQWATSVTCKFRFSQENESSEYLIFTPSYTLKRNMIARLTKGIAPFLSLVRPFWINRISECRKLFSSRQRSRDQRFKVSPLIVEYSHGIFRDNEQRKRLVRCIKSYPHSSISVDTEAEHIHVSITDFLDGSSFDVWQLSTHRIVVVPQLRATPRAVERICAYITEEFQDGEVKEYKE